MRNNISLILISLFLFTKATGQMPADVKKYSLNEIIQTMNGSKWNEFLNTETMHAGIYQLKKGQADDKKNYTEDGTYYLIKGNGKLKTDSGTVDVMQGYVLYIKAGCEHQFTEIKDKLVILAVFPKTPVEQDSKGFIKYPMAQTVQLRSADQNGWNPFLRSKSMVFGLYMLPKKIGGDSTLTHKVDELNYVTHGSGKFTIDNYTMDVKEDDIVFVGKGHGHYFHDLNSDFDVLILWEKKSLVKK